MKLNFRNTRWVLSSICGTLSLTCAIAFPRVAQAIDGQSSGPTVPARATTPSPLPAPTGPHEVGRLEVDWVDTARPDPDSPSGHREIAVWLWYPASPKIGAEAAEWMPGRWGELLLTLLPEQKIRQELFFRKSRQSSRNIPSRRFGHMPIRMLRFSMARRNSLCCYLNPVLACFPFSIQR